MSLIYKAKGSRTKFTTIYIAALLKVWEAAGLESKHKNSVTIPFNTEGSECQEAFEAMSKMTEEQLATVYDQCVEQRLWNPSVKYDQFTAMVKEFIDFLSKCKNGYEA